MPIEPAKSDEIIVAPRFVDREFALRCMQYADVAGTAWATIVHSKVDGGGNLVETLVEDRSIRRARFVLPRGPMQAEINAVLARVSEEVVRREYGATVESWEWPRILKYGRTGLYSPHTDAGYYEMVDGTRVWKRTHARDYSALLYLNDGYIGGALDFPYRQVRIKPKAGMLIVFPSNGDFVHQVRSVRLGTRYAIATWFKVRESSSDGLVSAPDVMLDSVVADGRPR
jgi:predicted 2-oxoglutarate/Fe(II)-dependent dioxygenase YbiX